MSVRFAASASFIPGTSPLLFLHENLIFPLKVQVIQVEQISTPTPSFSESETGLTSG